MKPILRFNDWPLAIKFLVAMMLVTLIPLIIVAYLNANNTQSALDDQIGSTFEQQAQDESKIITGFLEKQVDVLEALSADNQIRTVLESRNKRYAGSDEEILARLLELDETWRNSDGTDPLISITLSSDPTVNSVTPSLLRFEELFDEHVEIFVTDARGGTVGATDLLSDYYQADEQWWQAAYNNGEGAVFISDPEFDESTHITAVLMAVPFFSEGDHGEILGIIRTTIDIQSLIDKMGLVTFGETGRAMLLNTQGEIIVDPQTDSVAQLPAETRLRILGSNGVGVYEDEYGSNTVYGHHQVDFLGGKGETAGTSLSPGQTHIKEALDNLGWNIVIRQSASEAFAPVATANRLAIITIVAAILIAGGAAFGLSRFLTRQLGRISELFNAIGIGDFDARVEVTSGDELGQMAASLNTMLDNTLILVQTQEERDALQASIQKLLEEVSDVAEGDLTVEAEVTTDATGAIADSFNVMIAQLRTVISQVQDATLQVSSSANQIQTTAEHLSQGSETQASQIIDTSAAIDEMAVSIQQVSENAVVSATVAEQAITNARQGAQAVQDTIDGMNRIRDQVQETAKRIKRLGESSQEIGEIIQLIRGIAKRTNLLALNASLEAAMAGDAGRGFAVVAEDVKRLAERSTTATRQIAELIATIQNTTNEAVAAMEESTQEVVRGSEVANQAGRALTEIESVSNRLAELIQSISLAAKQQARGSEAVVHSMGEIAEVTQQTAAGTKEAAISINNLAALADELRGSLSTFKLPNGNGRGN